jgi:SRSO17 transposase
MKLMTQPPHHNVEPDGLLSRLDEWLQPFHSELRRQDQQRWASVYVLGLLRPGERKTIEHMARTLSVPPEWGVRDVSQALQHFIHRSPWDPQLVTSLLQAHLAPSLSAAGELLVEEMTFVKQGSHSVGVQRQHSHALGRKVNCQVAVALHHVGPTRSIPLGLRLYLPHGWAAQKAKLEVAGVPAVHQPAATKARIALDLIAQAVRNGTPFSGVSVVPGFGSEMELREGVHGQGLTYRGMVKAEASAIHAEGRRVLFEGLGLDHFEGRSWNGFHHHACLVLLARAFLLSSHSAI